MAGLPPDSDEDLDKPFSFVPRVRLKAPFGPDNQPTYSEDADSGMGVRHLRPAIFGFFPWTTLTIDDEYVIVINGEEAASGFITDTTASAYYVTVARMPPGVVEIRGLVIRAHSKHRSYSPAEKVLVIPTHPAGFDQESNKSWHSGLKMSIEDKPRGSSITADTLETGFWCLINKHLYARKNDALIVRCGGINTRYVLSEQDAKGPGPYRVQITPKTLEQIAKSGEIEVVYTVENVVKSRPGGDYQFSESYKLVSELEPNLRGSPYLLKDGVLSNDLNLSEDSQATLEIEITPLPTKPIPKPPYKIAPIVTLLEGDKVLKTVRLPAVQDNGRGATVTIALDYALFTDVAADKFRLTYESQTSTGVTLGTSSSSLVTLMGLPVSLPPVTVEGLLAGQLTSDKDVIVTIPKYRPYNSNWTETFRVEAIDSSANYQEPQLAGTDVGTRRLTKENLKKFDGKRVYFYYTVDKGDGNDALTSEKVEILVGTWVGELDAPIVELARDGFLNPKNVLDPEFNVIFPFLDSLKGDILSYSWTTQNSAGSDSGTFTITGANEGQSLPVTPFPLARRLVDNNLGTEITFRYSVERPGKKPQVFRSKVAYLYIGRAPMLQPAYVVEAGELQDEIKPRDVTKGATVVAEFTEERASDVVIVKWAGTYNLSTIELQAIWDAKTKKFYATIPPNVISRGVRKDGNPITVTYSFTRGRLTYTSKPQTLYLKPLEYRPAPVIIDAGAGETLLRLYQLTDAARTQIAKWNLINENQVVYQTYTGTFADDTAYTETVLDGEPVRPEGVSKGVSSATPVANLRRLKNGTPLTIEFWVDLTESGDKDVALMFDKAEYIIDAIAPKQSAPAFANIPGAKQSIYPLDYEKTAFVAVTYTGMNTKQKFALQWIYPDGTQAPINVQSGVSTGRIDFPISEKIMAMSVGKVITIRYTVTEGSKITTSDAQELTVQTILAVDMPQILANGVVDGQVLDLRNIKGDAKLALPKWRLSVPGQLITVTARGKNVTPLVVLKDYPITATEALNGLKDIPLLKSWLDDVSNDENIRINYNVAYNGIVDGPSRVEGRVTTYPIKIYDFENFETYPDKLIRAVNDVISTQFMEFKLIYKRSSIDFLGLQLHPPGWYRIHTRGTFINNYVGYNVDPNFTYNIILTGRTSKRITFWVGGGNITIVNPTLKFTFLDSKGVVLGQQIFNHSSTYYHHNELFIDSGLIGDIKTVEVSASSQFFMDEFKMY